MLWLVCLALTTTVLPSRCGCRYLFLLTVHAGGGGEAALLVASDALAKAENCFFFFRDVPAACAVPCFAVT